MQLSEALVQLGGAKIVGNDQQVDVGVAVEVDVEVAVGVAPGRRAEQPGAVALGPCGKPLAQSPDQLASKTGQSQHRPGGEVVPVQHDHRRSAGDRLAHQSSLDEFLDDGQRLEQRAADGRCDVEYG